MIWKISLAALMAVLAGCVSYVPAPIDVQASAGALGLRRLDSPEAIQAIQRLHAARQMQTTWPPQRYGIEELTDAALVLNADLRAAHQEIAVAQASVSSAQQLPPLGIGLAFDRYLEQVAGSSAWAWGIALDLPVTAITQRQLKAAMASDSVRLASLGFTDLLWQTRNEIRTSLQALLSAQLRAQRLGSLLADREDLLAAYEARLAAGEVAASERHQVLLESLRSRQELDANAAARIQARARLAKAVGVPLAAMDQVELRWQAFDSPSAPVASELAALREQALLGSSEVLRALTEYDNSERQLQLMVRGQYPELTIGPGYTFDHGVRKLNLNLGLIVPLGGNAGPIAEASARREAAGARLEAAQAMVMADVDAANAQLDHAMLALANARSQTQLAERVSSAAERAMRAGEGDRVEWIHARIAASSAGLVELDALEMAQTAAGALAYALRMPAGDQMSEETP